MAKLKTFFVCNECGTRHEKWQGRCKGCGVWNSLVEEMSSVRTGKSESRSVSIGSTHPKPLSEIEGISEKRLVTPDQEMNRILGGGLVSGSVILLGGEPGIGKSTLLLQLALRLSPLKILYVSGEESEMQIRMRADRLPWKNENLLVAGETRVEMIMRFQEELKADILIVDSIQTVWSEEIESAPGSVSQVRDCAMRLMRLAKETNVPVFLVGHITKDGMIAGPKVLEHMVDVVLNFEGDQHNAYRVVRTAKNRFGSTLELGIYEMLDNGLREVSNPSEVFLSSGDTGLSGVAISATIEGMRPLLIETQALVSPLAYGTAQRSSTGFDLRRLNMLLAVLEKRCGFKMGAKDVFVNMAGGLKVEDPALDLGLICAIVSSLHDLPVDRKKIFAAEVGLTGEVRPVTRIEQRISEAEKLGFTDFFLATGQEKGLKGGKFGIRIHSFSRLEEVFKVVFG